MCLSVSVFCRRISTLILYCEKEGVLLPSFKDICKPARADKEAWRILLGQILCCIQIYSASVTYLLLILSLIQSEVTTIKAHDWHY